MNNFGGGYIEGENYHFGKDKWIFIRETNEITSFFNDKFLHIRKNEFLLFDESDHDYCPIVINHLIRFSGFWAKCIKVGENNKVWFSIKEYQKEQLAKIEDGAITEARVIFASYSYLIVETNQVFFHIPIKEVSATRFTDLSKVYYPGQKVLIYMVNKEKGMASIKWAYRDLLEYSPYRRGDYVTVTIGARLADKTGYFVEVTPHVGAIMDYGKFLKEGEQVVCQIKSKKCRGPVSDLKLSYVSLPDDTL